LFFADGGNRSSGELQQNAARRHDGRFVNHGKHLGKHDGKHERYTAGRSSRRRSLEV
jgi:hypothetical protein